MEQDWQPYSLNKQNTHNRNSEKNVNKIIQGGANVDTVKKYNAGHNHNHAVQNVGKKAEAEETKLEHVSHDFKIALMQARQAAELKQSELAQRINEKTSVINDYESGRAYPDPQIISKMERVLKVKLPRKKKEKKTQEDDY